MATTEGSVGSAKRSKIEKTRRGWTEREEQVLLASLRELVASSWKSDYGFRAGYIQKLAQSIRKEFPNTNLKATPHITSRLTAWKRNYSSLVTVLSHSGVGFNVNGDFKVEANDEQWDSLILSDDNVSKIRNKSWPLFEGWKEVFGKDRATGEHAEDVMDAVNDLMNENVDDFVMAAEKFVEELDGDEHTKTEDTSTGQSKKETSTTAERKRKKRNCGGLQSMCDLLERIYTDTNARPKDLAARFGFASDVGQVRKEVFTLINKVPGLNLGENFKVCDKLLERPERLEFFMGLPEVAREDYAVHLLHDHQNSA